MADRFSALTRRRLLGVGLALVVDVCLVGALTRSSAPVEAGIPGVVAAAIAGTVAVVFGPLDGIAVALVGAALFGCSLEAPRPSRGSPCGRAWLAWASSLHDNEAQTLAGALSHAASGRAPRQ